MDNYLRTWGMITRTIQDAINIGLPSGNVSIKETAAYGEGKAVRSRELKELMEGNIIIILWNCIINNFMRR